MFSLSTQICLSDQHFNKVQRCLSTWRTLEVQRLSSVIFIGWICYHLRCDGGLRKPDTLHSNILINVTLLFLWDYCPLSFSIHCEWPVMWFVITCKGWDQCRRNAPVRICCHAFKSTVNNTKHITSALQFSLVHLCFLFNFYLPKGTTVVILKIKVKLKKRGKNWSWKWKSKSYITENRNNSG